MFLNDEPMKFKGVCNHHDLGPIGAAINVSALRRQLTLLKEMGCNAIRTSHNMPAPELVALCDEMGFMMMVEAFDEWIEGKNKNGYGLYFKEWAEKDLVNTIHHYRNNPSVVMWSIGNEVFEQNSAEGAKTARFLQDICHREDPTRKVTTGMNNVGAALKSHFAATMDVPGMNYLFGSYENTYKELPQQILLGSETASTISSRGHYHFPVERGVHKTHDDRQNSGYDVEYMVWGNLPEEDFVMQRDYAAHIGEFVWTGFDYLGEPAPYQTMWPNHSSVFGIIDLAGIPKDRYYLYRSYWNPQAETLHILPHWTWSGREGEVTPVFVYTNYPSAELFVNGKSQGRVYKEAITPDKIADKDKNWVYQRHFRLMWMDVKYEPGAIKVIAYDEAGKAVAEKEVKTAGKPHHLELTADRNVLDANGKDLSFITVRVVDKDGNLCPNDQRLISFVVKGNGTYKASANGDPTCLDLFHKPQMHAFSGELTTIVQAGEQAGELILEAHAKELKTNKVKIMCQNKQLERQTQR
jgi:beta-galactosidase